MATKPQLILAYDRSTFNPEDIRLLKNLVPMVDMVKLGFEAMSAEEPLEGGACSVAYLVRDFLHDRDEFDSPIPIMWDAKLNDVYKTVSRTLPNIIRSDVHFVTLHANMSEATLRRAVEICKGTRTRPVAVTLLSDMTEADTAMCFDASTKDATLRFACRARMCGFEHIVCSAQELEYLRDGRAIEEFKLIVVGIRHKMPAHGQVRIATPREAARLGADYIVLGTEVTGASDPLSALKAIHEDLENL